MENESYADLAAELSAQGLATATPDARSQVLHVLSLRE